MSPKPAWARGRGLRGRLRLPGRRPLLAAVVVLGVLSAATAAFLPVRAAFGDDPILRLRSLDTTSAGPVTDVECGSALRGLQGGDDAVTLYGIARDRACRDAAARRLLSAFAAAAIVVLLGFQSVAASSPRLAARV